MIELNTEKLEEIIKRAQTPIGLDGSSKPIMVLPHESVIHDLEGFMDRPSRIERNLTVTTLDSFCKYYNEHKDARSNLYADLQGTSVLGVLDDHAAKIGTTEAIPSWCDHRVKYICPFSRQWQAWKEKDRRKLGQVEFAEWLEDHTQDVQTPPGAELLALCLDLQVHRKVSYGNATRLQSGETSFSYSQNNEAGSVEIPSVIELGIPVFERGTVYKITARLRYRLSEGQLTLWFELVEPERYVEDAFSGVIDDLEDACEQEPIDASLASV